MDKTIIFNNNIRNKQKYQDTLQHLKQYKIYRRKCKDCINDINNILANDTIKSIQISSNSINDPAFDSSLPVIYKLVTSLIIYNQHLKLNILHMVYYQNKMIEIYTSIK